MPIKERRGMKNENGFSLIEVIVAMVLLGIVICGTALFKYHDPGIFARNVAVLIAERKIEDCRELASTGFANLSNDSDSITIMTHGKNVTYNWNITVDSFNYRTNAVNRNGTNTLNLSMSSMFTAANSANINNAQIKRVRVTISVGAQTLATRTALIARYY